ncbi:unnamed protein product [Spodoptera exigua]|nr:unnamed protein product [Spodoptera exigua]
MSHFLKVLMVILVFVKQEADLALTLRKFVNQKDLSEYCRRRVMPSVFLGRHVVDAYSKILQFSRLELPYSCYISVRTESGSNIILVIQLVSSRNLVESCRESKNQLLVYELGETFGGYWGALPNRVMDMSPKKDEIQYTIKTTQPATTTRTKARTRRPPTTTTSTTESDVSTNSEERPVEYFVEIPIVNVSLELAPGRLPDKSLFDNEDVFDKIVDVKPWPNDTYKTKVLPLLQFSLENKDIGGALRSTVSVEPEIPKYQVQFNPDIFTTDYRSLPMFQYPTFVSPAHDILFTSHYSTSQFLGNAEPASESWDAVNAILKNLNRSEHVSNKPKIDDVASLLQGLAKIGPNKTGTHQGLVPHVSIARHPVTSAWHSTMGYKTDSITWRQPSATYRTNYLDDEEEETGTTQVTSSTMDNKDGSTGFLLPILDADNVVLNFTQSEKNEPSSLEESATSTIGQHVTSTTLATTTRSTFSSTLTRQRRKRYIHAIAINHVKPHHLPVQLDISTPTPPSDRISNAQEFQRFIELQDDEIHDRVVKRHLRHYVGPVLFNICDFNEPAARHIYMFNSSRLVLAISNFTLESMTVVITPARTLLSSDAHCPSANLECQVSGARVCIDSLSACDGVPNCGSYGKEEEEMQSLDFDSTIVVTGSVASINTDISEKKLEHANVQKKLRFDEEIKAVSHSDNDNVEEVHGRPRWSVMYGTEKNVHLEQLGSANRVDEPSTSTNKKGHFWGSSKSKPKKQPKKKTQLLPTLKF